MKRYFIKDELPKDELLKVRSPTDHMANERTFLAWIRTAIGIMAFGFVVEKFTLFTKQVSYFLEHQGVKDIMPSQSGYSSVFGVLLVSLGAFIGLLSFFKYKNDEKHINEDTYKSTSSLALLLVLSVVVMGVFLTAYLIYT